MAGQPTIFEDPILSFPTRPPHLDPLKSLSLHSAVFLSMRIDNPQPRRRSVHKFTPQDLVPALKSSLVSVMPPLPSPLPAPAASVEAKVRARIPTTTGAELFVHVYHNDRDDKEHLAFVIGDDIRSNSLDAVKQGETETDRIIRGARIDQTARSNPSTAAVQSSTEIPAVASTLPPLVRVHSECLTGEILHSFRCDCGEQLDAALELIREEGRGVVLYLRQEGRGIGLTEKLKSYNLQDLGHDTVTANLLLNHPADPRTYDVATAMLKDLGLDKIRLLTNNPDKIELLQEGGIEVVDRVGMTPRRWEGEHLDGAEREVDRYLKTKVVKMRHILDLPAELDGKI